jgi:hypothetical protein
VSLVQRVRAAGIELKLGDDGRLLCRGDLSDEKRGFIRAHKAELIAELQRSNGNLAEIIDLEKARRAIAERTEARERRRRLVLERLEANPELMHVFVVDDSTDPVIVAVAVRGIATAELAIDRERWDPFRFVGVTGGRRRDE